MFISQFTFLTADIVERTLKWVSIWSEVLSLHNTISQAFMEKVTKDQQLSQHCYDTALYGLSLLHR